MDGGGRHSPRHDDIEDHTEEERRAQEEKWEVRARPLAAPAASSSARLLHSNSTRDSLGNKSPASYTPLSRRTDEARGRSDQVSRKEISVLGQLSYQVTIC